jgi:hypothetical protein
MLNRPLLQIAVVGVLAVGLSACGSGTKAATPSPSNTSPSNSVTPTSSPSPTTGAPTTPQRARTVVQLKSALLKLADFPSGYSLEPASSGNDEGSASSKDPKCAPLVKLTNAKNAPGSKASAKASFSGGQDGPFVEESIDALVSADAVKALQAAFKSAVASCREVIVTIPGLGKSTMKVVEVSAPKFGEHTFALRLTATGGSMNGMEITQVTAGVKDTVVSMVFVAAGPQDVDAGTEAAVNKAKEILGG